MNAQIHEVGLFLGGSNYIGDIGPTNHIAPSEPALGVLYKWNKSTRHSWRFSYTQSKVTSNDQDAKTPGRTERGYRFENNVKEVAAGLEFNFFDFNLHNFEKKITPYVYTGLSYFVYDELFVVGRETKKKQTDKSFAIPMTVGLKSNIAPHFILGFEVGARYTFTDNIDGSNPKNKNSESLKFGNINNNDWYVFTGLTLTYTFGNKPCYCAE
jgi:hypothetical protein